MDAKSQWLSTVLIAVCLGCLGGWLAAQQQLQQPLEPVYDFFSKSAKNAK